MRAQYVNENIEFERGRDPRKAMDVGVAVENRDIFQMEKNFKESFPEVQHTHTGEQHLIAPGGPHPKWKTITVSLHNPKDGISVDERKEKYLNWFKQNTDYDEFKIDSAFDRYWHPWGDETKPEQYDQQFTFHMRHKDFFNESYNFERGQDPKRSMRVGDPLTVMEMLLKDLASDPSMSIYAINPNKGHGFITITTTPLDGKYVRVSQMIDKFEELGLDKYFKYSTVEQENREKYFYFDILPEYGEYLNFPSKGQELLANPIINESYNFERGKDPKRAMEVGRAGKVNYFRDNLDGYPYEKVIERDGPWPWDQGRAILKKAAEMLDIPEADVQVAVEYENEPLTTARIEEYIDDHEWNYDTDETIGDFDLIKTSTGEIYIFEAGEQTDPYMILGSPF